VENTCTPRSTNTMWPTTARKNIFPLPHPCYLLKPPYGLQSSLSVLYHHNIITTSESTRHSQSLPSRETAFSTPLNETPTAKTCGSNIMIRRSRRSDLYVDGTAVRHHKPSRGWRPATPPLTLHPGSTWVPETSLPYPPHATLLIRPIPQVPKPIGPENPGAPFRSKKTCDGGNPLDLWGSNIARLKRLTGLRHPSHPLMIHPGNTREHIETTTPGDPSSSLHTYYMLIALENSRQLLLSPRLYHVLTAHS